jgi:release factor glutamine methyltransferase
MTRREALAAATRLLSATSETARLDSELLMAHALGITREALLLGDLAVAVPGEFAALIDRRSGGEPVAYITGHRAFWTIELEVGPGVLIPRPDSETLIEAAVDHFGSSGPRRVLDLGTGPGTLLLAVLDQWQAAKGIGIDRSPTALDYARRNAARLGLAARCDFRLGDWCEGIEDRYDLVLCNPPYVESDAALSTDVMAFEPHGALFAGADGLDDLRLLAKAIPGVLAADGVALIEIGSSQGEAALRLFGGQGAEVSFRTDLAGRHRCVVFGPLRRKETPQG